jgi:hypothetical protein
MKKIFHCIMIGILSLSSQIQGDPHEATQAQKDESAVRDFIEDAWRAEKKNMKVDIGNLSSKGSVEFFSSGGLLQELSPQMDVVEYEIFTVVPKHVHCVSLVPGKAVVAMYYAEGAEQFKGQSLVPKKLVRITQVYVKEDGAWKIRAAHWSPLTGGQGTSNTSVEP